jgi:hypothetical protein
MVGFQLLGSLECSLETGWRQRDEKSLGDSSLKLPAADAQAPLASAVTNRAACTIISRRRMATAVIDAQAAPAASTLGDSLQQRCALSHRSSSLVRTRMGVLRQP